MKVAHMAFLGGMFYRTHKLRNVTQSLRRSLHSSSIIRSKSEETKLEKHLKSKIKMTGPITVAEYMNEVLTNPVSGYYMNRDVFGKSGDFITSPEISQMFGELLGVWVIHEWISYGKPEKIQVVELGPGRGTLASDMCRVFSQFDGIENVVSLHLVEVSPKMMELQEMTLCGNLTDSEKPPAPSAPSVEDKIETFMGKVDSDIKEEIGTDTWIKKSTTQYGQPVYWHKSLFTVPNDMTFYIAHEFLDALPVHKFQKRKQQWSEVVVVPDEREDSPHHLGLALSAKPTIAARVLLKGFEDDTRDHIEVCAEAGAVTQTIANRLKQTGGAALYIDYGHTGNKTDTIRAFKDHALHPLLAEPGTADITADVDFAYLARVAKDIVNVHGPISQAEFLSNMGIQVRLKKLLERATPEQQKDHVSAIKMLTSPEQMGERFKCMCLMPKPRDESNKYVPAGFKSIPS